MKIGDKVLVLDDSIQGIVKKVSGTVITILTEDDFEIEFAKNELVIDSNSFSEKDLIPKDISAVLLEKKSKKNKNLPRVQPKKRVLPPMIVDLHIHQLVSNQKGMSNYDMLTIQTDTAKRQLNFAIQKRIQKVVFIHGVGEGVLKEELEYLFRRYENVKYYDADYQKYGKGATEVYIYQSKIS
ncbi:MAG: hypothetical protein ACI9SJ_001469 [Flavobacteriaceae bacterium]|jgi:hypothetical protein|uniref:Smr/MutS family protein n=1 Tax=Candidatus Marifrigoribacter sp. Uisw_064 TaxID=3230970 RepID=UPI003ADE0D6F